MDITVTVLMYYLCDVTSSYYNRTVERRYIEV